MKGGDKSRTEFYIHSFKKGVIPEFSGLKEIILEFELTPDEIDQINNCQTIEDLEGLNFIK